jgi:hypothetical protein
MTGLEELMKNARAQGAPPVERWNPPYCGDIGLEIRRNGTWLYQGSPILRPALVKLFASVLRRDADERHYLVTPVEKVDVKVEDAPFLAVEMAAEGAGPAQRLVFRTNVDDVFACDAEHPLRFKSVGPEGGLKPYVTVRGRLEALLSRALYYDLVELAVTETRDGSAVLGLWSGEVFFPLAERV